MDGLSAVANVIAVIQLTGSVVAYVKSAKGATEERNNLRRELRACESLLKELQDESEDSEEGEAWSETIKALDSDGGPLRNLKIALETVQAKLKPRHGVKNVRDILTWPFKEKDVKEIIAAIEHEKSLLSLALENNSRKLIQAIQKTGRDNQRKLEELLETIQKSSDDHESHFLGIRADLLLLQGSQAEFHTRQIQRERSKEELAILNWLTPLDYTSRKNEYLEQKVDGTGQWLLESDEFRVFVESARQTLFCPGIPGAGKTMTSSVVIEDLTTRFQQDESSAVAYIYCDYQREQEQSFTNFLASLLKQLSHGWPSLPESVLSLHEAHRGRERRPTQGNLFKALQSVVSLYAKVFVIIDALDEASSELRNDLMQAMSGLQHEETGDVRIFVTARTKVTDRFDKYFAGYLSREIRASESDLFAYTLQRLSKLERVDLSEFPDVEEKITRGVIQAADGMFLLAKLYLDRLCDFDTVGDIEDALDDMPKGVAGLDMLYEKTMERIGRQKEGRRRTALKVLCWVIHARYRLTTDALQWAVATPDGTGELSLKHVERYLQEVKALVSDCAGLVTISKNGDKTSSSTIRLFHYTTREYFERTKKHWFPDAETAMAKTCARYLSLNDFRLEGMRYEFRKFPLFRYAVHNWGRHARCASTLAPEVVSFLESPANVKSATYQVPCSLVIMPGLGAAAYFGVGNAVEQLLRKTENSNIETLAMALGCAIGRGYDAVVELILDRGAEVGLINELCQPMLFKAAQFNGPDAIGLVLDRGVDVNQTDREGRTALFYAVSNFCHTGTVKSLLDRGADVNQTDRNGQTALFSAVSDLSLDEDNVKILLDRGVDVNRVDRKGQTALFLAASRGYDDVVELLLDRKAEVDLTDRKGQTALFLAVSRDRYDYTDRFSDEEVDSMYGRVKGLLDQTSTARLLLLRGGSATTIDKNGASALHILVDSPNYSIETVELLLSHGAPASLTDFDGVSPLHHAVKFGRWDVAELLIRHGASVDMSDESGRTLLHFAAAAKDATMAHNSLVIGVQRLALNAKGETALHSAVSPESCLTRLDCEYWPDVVDVLLNNSDADVNSRDANGDTPLHRLYGDYGYGGWQDPDMDHLRLRITGRLLRSGADASARNAVGQTPLHRACTTWCHETCQETTVSLLLSGGASLAAVDQNGNNALHFAIKSWPAVSAVWGACGADVALQLGTARNKYGRTPLHELGDWATLNSVQMLLEVLTGAVAGANAPADVNYSVDDDDNGRAEELSASYWAVVGAADNDGNTPLACYFSRASIADESVVRLLLQYTDPKCVNVQGLTLAHLYARGPFPFEDLDGGRCSHGMTVSMLESLQRAGVDLTATDLEGKTILHHGVIHQRLDDQSLVFLLDRIGLHTDVEDVAETTPLEYARRSSVYRDFTEFLRILEEHQNQ